MNLLARYAPVALVSACFGFLGSLAHDWVRSVQKVVRAERFEVVDAGKLVSYWGPDSDPQMPASTPKGVIMVFMDLNGVRRAELGSSPGDNGPELRFFDHNGPSEARFRRVVPEPRFVVRLGYNDDPELGMRGPKDWRVTLGAAHGDMPDPAEDSWALHIRGGQTADASVVAGRSSSGQDGAGVRVRQNGKSWSLPPR